MSPEKLALTLYTILLFHMPAILFVFFFALYFFYKAPKNETSKLFLAILGALLLWLVSKVLKTLSPTLTLRWSFVVLQYVGVHALGFLLIHFAYLYSKNRRPAKWFSYSSFALCLGSFLLVLTNPIHMKFYASFDFYYDRFGPLFLPSQIVQYILILYAAILLVLGYRKNSVSYSKKITGCLLSFFTVAPLVVNVYYILFKLVDIPWLMPFAVFDVTPISISIALIFFIIPALKMRFLDLRSFANHHIYKTLSQGIISFTDQGIIQSYNPFCERHFPYLKCGGHLNTFLDGLEETDYSLYYHLPGKGSNHLFIHDIRMLSKNRKELQQKSQTLQLIRSHLYSNSQTKLNKALFQVKSSFAQDLHDIVGHSLTILMASKKSLLSHKQTSSLKAELSKLRHLFSSSLQRIQKRSDLQEPVSRINSLESLLNELNNPKININYLSKGEQIPLPGPTKTTLYRVAQESVTNAIKHGDAKNIFFVVHYHATHLKLLIYDDGAGAKAISPNMGLNGICQKIGALSGTVAFGSDGNKGFHTDITIPI